MELKENITDESTEFRYTTNLVGGVSAEKEQELTVFGFYRVYII